MKLLMGLIAWILAPLLFTTILALIAQATILNPHYVEKAADESNVYSALSKLVPEMIAHGDKASTPQEQEQVKKIVAEAIPPDEVKQIVEKYVHGVEDHYTKGSPLPALDVAGVTERLRHAGITIDSGSMKPVGVIPPETDAKIKNSLSIAHTANQTTLITTIALLFILLLLSIKLHSYHDIGIMFFVCAVLLAGLAFGLSWSFEWGMSTLRSQQGMTQQLIPVLESFGRLLLQGVETKLVQAAIISVVISLIIAALAIISHLRHKPPKSIKGRVATA